MTNGILVTQPGSAAFLAISDHFLTVNDSARASSRQPVQERLRRGSAWMDQISVPVPARVEHPVHCVQQATCRSLKVFLRA